MRLFTPAIRISLILMLFTLSILLTADSIFKFSEDSTNALTEVRKNLCETLVYQASFLIHNDKEDTLVELISVITEYNPDILSMALNDKFGRVSIITDGHEAHWVELAPEQSTLTQAQLPIFNGEVRWGTLQIRFKSGSLFGLIHLLQNPFIKLTLFVSLLGFLVYLWFIKKTLQYLDPSALIPERVKTTLDALVEGVIFIDMKGCIVLANNSFEKVLAQPLTSLMGQNISKLNWELPTSKQKDHQLPWLRTLKDGQSQFGSHLILLEDSGRKISFNVNSSPIHGGKGEIRGAVVSFADVTELEKMNKQLINTMQELNEVHKEVLRQNQELEKLATRDPLTGCLNRRAFFEKLEIEFIESKKNDTELCCIMGDIDHFKNINDTYGHRVGDIAIKSVAKTLISNVRNNDLICRYGGEEFCVLLINMDLDQATEVVERMRHAIQAYTDPAIRKPADIKITLSFGISSIRSGANNIEELIDQADTALYASKKNGRNQVNNYSANKMAKAN